MEVLLQKVAKSYGATVAVQDVTVGLTKGEMLALLGPSGCGKTTTLRMVAGFIRPTEGRILIAGRDITHLPPHKRDTGLVFQNYALFPHMTVTENIAFGLRRRRVDSGELTDRVRSMIAKMQLDGLEARLPRELSGGQQQRVAVARALVINPSVLLLDEPFSNLDAKLRESTGLELRRIQKDLGLTSIFVTHDQHEAMAIADRVAVMNSGRVEQIGSAADIYERPRTRFVAEFVGRANFLAAEVVGSEATTAQVRCAGTILSVPVSEGPARIGARGTLMLRPEAVELSAPEGGDAVSIGEVETLAYQGSLAHVGLRLATGERVLAEVEGRGHEQWRPGTPAGLTLDPEHAMLYLEGEHGPAGDNR